MIARRRTRATEWAEHLVPSVTGEPGSLVGVEWYLRHEGTP
ncbi:hypothetical protein I545_1295 [Mycobacterium kansasii 662]|uniref:Uncharacterized protein n=2 Tax=Mycobacterium kansasii TaxID=1768 RepID=A0A1V3XUR7_MYCKA|nr:hypothetical protein I547_5319 [Mycobacterium kansasii 824]EUA20721.1 hypothetical protein I545_1295 [Mycobacterium kansasii 662]KEP42650.1 hypothetical protein MKSMC1_22040 [Mycobacterium kansasii]OOK82945.1 hypothetical protein BZL30_0232 [Mycobacterium kansasii]OOK83657.1 hypothetical protein BZL29_1577 [Mycobacterium kansasii]